MEIIVPVCVSALIAISVALALDACGKTGQREGADVRADPLGAVRAFGRALEYLGVGGLPPVRAAAGELRAWARDPEGSGSFRAGGWTCLVEGPGALGLLVLVQLASGALGFILLGSFPAAFAACAVPVVCLLARRGARGRARIRELEAAMPDAFGALAVALGSGHSLSQAMRFVGVHAREPVRSEFMRVSFAIDCGIPAGEALDGLLERLDAPGLELVALALKVSQRTGAPLRDLLARAADVAGTRVELKRRLEVKTSQARMSARLVAAMPIGMIGALSLVSSDFRVGMTRPVGALSISVALVLNAVAWAIIARIMKVRM